jgi:hypothetical protein
LPPGPRLCKGGEKKRENSKNVCLRKRNKKLDTKQNKTKQECRGWGSGVNPIKICPKKTKSSSQC